MIRRDKQQGIAGQGHQLTPALPARSDLLVPTRSALRAFVPQRAANSFHRHPGGSNRLTLSQHARLTGKTVPQAPNDQPGEKLSERIPARSKFKSHGDARK
jgi:hypothetical protein